MNISKPSGILVLAKQALKQEVTAFSSSRQQSGDKRSEEETQSKTGPANSNREEFSKKLRMKTPLGKLDEHSTHPHQEKEPLKPWPNNTNPNTGEIGGPAGPEPTRYGDWERKGRVTDF